MSIFESKYYRKQHVTGPGCVLVSIKFGVTPEDGVRIFKRLRLDNEQAEVQFDLENHVLEIVSGVTEANTKFGGNLEVEEVEVVPNDYPQKGQAKYAAFKITEHLLRNGT